MSKQQEKKILIMTRMLSKKIEGIEENIKDLELSDKKKRAKVIRRNKSVRFPKTLDILGNTWRVELEEYLENSEGKVNGLCHWRTRRISLCLSDKNIVETLLHEVQHAIDYEFGNCFDELRRLKGNKLFDEFRVSTLAKIWVSVFKQLRGNAKVDAK
ncbi:hypothetical protein LCGC14_1529080 [marine sediment metagenome]|uniref:Uncharacterized protein n=1 Tax=marine sediment metagenome TaxID=412755 RepID=A0A0F9IWB4_9ZZZZ